MPVIKGRGEKRIKAESQAQVDSKRSTHKGAEAILAKAKESARQIVNEAREQVTQQVHQAHETGQREGFSEAEHMREEIRGLQQRMLKEVEAEAVRTAMSIARDLIDSEVKTRPDALVDIAVASLKAAQDAREVFLRVNPAAVQVLRQRKQRLVDVLSMAREVDIRVDRNVELGGVLIQTENGVIDASLETQLGELSRILGA